MGKIMKYILRTWKWALADFFWDHVHPNLVKSDEFSEYMYIPNSEK